MIKQQYLQYSQHITFISLIELNNIYFGVHQEYSTKYLIRNRYLSLNTVHIYIIEPFFYIVSVLCKHLKIESFQIKKENYNLSNYDSHQMHSLQQPANQLAFEESSQYEPKCFFYIIIFEYTKKESGRQVAHQWWGVAAVVTQPSHIGHIQVQSIKNLKVDWKTTYKNSDRLILFDYATLIYVFCLLQFQ